MKNKSIWAPQSLLSMWESQCMSMYINFIDLYYAVVKQGNKRKRENREEQEKCREK